MSLNYLQADSPRRPQSDIEWRGQHGSELATLDGTGYEWHCTFLVVVVIVVSVMQLSRLCSILHRWQFWAKSAASGNVRWWCLRSYWTVLSHVIRGRPGCLLQSAGGEANRILLVSVLSSMCTMFPNWVSRCDWLLQWV